MPTADYAARARANARDLGGTIWFGDPDSPGVRTTPRACKRLGRPTFLVVDGVTRPSEVVALIEAEGIGKLNVAGYREGTSPGIGGRVERFMSEVFRRMAYR